MNHLFSLWRTRKQRVIGAHPLTFLLAVVVAMLSSSYARSANVQANSIAVRIQRGGADNTQTSQFNFIVVNTGTSAQSNISVRLYFQLDGSQVSSSYVLDRYWDQSNVATITGPTEASGGTYYYTVNYGGASLAAGASWQFNAALHLVDWTQNFDATNDWFHTGYPVDGLPGNATDTNYVPAYINGAHAWGQEPDGSGATSVGTSPPTQTSMVPAATNTTAATFQSPTTTGSGPTATPVSSTPASGNHVDNPFDGATWYVNPDYAADVINSANSVGGALGAKMKQVASFPTAVWLDQVSAVSGGAGVKRTLEGHLNAAFTQQDGSAPVVITFVVYDLPNRDCSALASNGEFQVSQDGLNKYKTQFIDPIASAMSLEKYKDLRIVIIVEPDSLPNLITNTSFPRCAEAQSSGAYAQGVQYAINKLHAIPNVYIYLDIAHSAWLGWDDNRTKAVTLYTQVIQGTSSGLNSIDGFISNISNYTPLQEPFLPDPNLMINNQPLKSAAFYQGIPTFDEVAYDTALYDAFIQAGFSPNIGMLVDTSRNGWGGPHRPTAVSTSTDLNTYVNESRIDRRLSRSNWCNQTGAGIGARPQANPMPHFDAFVWVKPPGESDGTSNSTQTTSGSEGKRFDPTCDPTQITSNGTLSGALPGAPEAGHWFEAEFEMLIQNAFPPFQ